MLLDLGLAVDRVQANAELEGAGDVPLLLDRVAVRDPLRRSAGGEHHLDLGERGGVEAGAELGQQHKHLRRRVCLDGIEHPGVRKGLGEGLIVVTNDVEIDDEAGAVLSAVTEELADARSHGNLPHGSRGGERPM